MAERGVKIMRMYGRILSLLWASLGVVLGGRSASAEDWFGPVVSTQLPFTALAAGYGDITGDGRLEVFVHNSASDLFVYSADASGNYSLAATRVGTYHYSTVGDTNGNGIPELLCANGSTLYIFEVEDGLLPTSPTSVPLNSSASADAIRCFDLDADGCDDVVFCGYRGVLVVWGVPDGPPGAGDYYELPLDWVCINSAFVDQTAIGDVTTDGLSDIVVAAHWGLNTECPPNQAAIRVLRRLGPRSFSWDAQWIGYFDSEGQEETQYTDLQLADLDTDAKLDLVAERRTGEFRLHRGLGNGSFVGVSPNIDDWNYNLIVLDLNGDGLLDLATGNGFWTKVYRGNGDFTFTEVDVYGAPGFGGRWISHGDATGDAVRDLVGMGSGSQSRINVYPGLLSTTAVEVAWSGGSDEVKIVPSVVGPNAAGCWFAAEGTRAGQFEVFDLRGRRVAVVAGQASSGSEVRGRWRLGAGTARPSAGVYLVRLGDRGPTGRVIILR